jgi:hypothetical protein
VSDNFYIEPRPVRKIPTREQIEAAARRQAVSEEKGSRVPSKHSIGSSAGFHPEEDDELEEDERYYTTRQPTSVRRYQSMPDVMTRQGRVNVVEHYHDQPLRAHRQQIPPPQKRERYTDEIEQIDSIPQRRMHPLVWIGVFGIFLVLGWFGLNAFTSWYQGVQNDWTYGKQRHFEINAVVGHGDSQTNPSHFTAENNNGQIIVIELPGGNVSKAKIYQIETVPGNTGNPPVKLSFQDMNGDGKVDMIVQIGDGNAMIFLTLYNNGTEFVSKL